MASWLPASRIDLAGAPVPRGVAPMSARPEALLARANAEINGDTLVVTLGGSWQITERRPTWDDMLVGRQPARVRLNASDVAQWDSSLLLFVFEAQQWCRTTGAFCDLDGLSERIRHLLGQLTSAHETSVPFDRSESFLTSVGLATQDTVKKAGDISRFVGDCTIAALQVVRRPRHFRWADCLHEMQQCG